MKKLGVVLIIVIAMASVWYSGYVLGMNHVIYDQQISDAEWEDFHRIEIDGQTHLYYSGTDEGEIW